MLLHHFANDRAVFADVDVASHQEVGLLQHLDGQLAVGLQERVGHVVKLVAHPNHHSLGLGLGDLVVGQPEVDVAVTGDLKANLRLVVVGRFDAHVHPNQRRQLLRDCDGVELPLADVVLVFPLVGGCGASLVVSLVTEVGRVRRGHGAAVRVVQIEPLERLFQRGVLRQTVVAHPPVGTHRRLEDVQRHVFCRKAQVGRHEGGNHHVLADGTKPWRVPDFIQLVLVVELVLTHGNEPASREERFPDRVGVGAVVVDKGGGPRHHRRREVARFVGRFVDVVLKVVVVAEEALVVARDVAVRRQFNFEVADGLQVRPNIEVLAVRFGVLVVQVGLLHQPAVGRGLLGKGARPKSVAVDVCALVSHQEGQSWRGEIPVKSGIRRLLRVTRQQRAFVAGVGAADVVQAHGEAQHVLHNVQLLLLLFLFVDDVAKAVSLLVAHFTVGRTGATLVVDLLQERHLVVEVLEVGLGVDGDVAAVLDGVAERVLCERRAVPSERTLVARVGTQPVRQRELVQGQLVRAVHLVVVRRDLPALHQAALDVLAVRVVSVGIVDFRGNQAGVLQNEGLRVSLVIELQGLRQIVLDRVVPVPRPCLHHLRGDDGLKLGEWIQHRHVVPHRAHLVHPLHLVGRRHLLGQQEEVDVPDELQVVRIPKEPDFGERLALLGLGLP